jgi:hypothetical protein
VPYHVLFSLFWLIFKSNAHCSFWAELLTKVESLRDAADVLADFVCAPAGRREKRLLSARAMIRAAIERSVRQGAAVTLTMA